MNGVVDFLIDISNLRGYIYGPFVRSKIIPYKRKNIFAPDVNEINVWFNNITSINLFKDIVIKSGGRAFNMGIDDVARVGEDDIRDDYKGKEEDLSEVYGVNSPKGIKDKMLFYPGNYDQTKTHFVAIVSRKLPFDFLENRIIFSCSEEGSDPDRIIKKRMRFFDLIKAGKLYFVTTIGNRIIPITVKNNSSFGSSSQYSSQPFSQSSSLSSSSSSSYSSSSNVNFGEKRFGRATSFLFNSRATSTFNSDIFNERTDRGEKGERSEGAARSEGAERESNPGTEVFEDVPIDDIIDNCVKNELIPTEKFVKKIISYECGSRECNQLMESILTKMTGVIIKYPVNTPTGIQWCGYYNEKDKSIILKLVSFYFFINCMNEQKYIPKFNYISVKTKKILN